MPPKKYKKKCVSTANLSSDMKPKPVPAKKKWSFHSTLAQSFINQENTDCSFELLSTLHPDSCKEIGAHKVVLAAASPVFRQMFYGSFKDSMPIRIEDIHFEVFQWFLMIIYKQKMVDLPENLKATPSCYIDVYKAAHKYVCTQTLVEIQKYVLIHIQEVPQEACSWLEVSKLYDDKDLRTLSESVISKNASVALQSQEFLQMHPENVALLYSFEKLMLNDEYELVVALERYLKTNCEFDLNNEHIKTAKKFIRFLLLTTKQIYETDILTVEEKAAILYCYNCYNLFDFKSIMQKYEFSTMKLPRLKPNTSPGIRKSARKRQLTKR